MISVKCVIFTLRIPGFHRWMEAPAKWGYLSNWHRHEFHIKCMVKIENDRQLEIIEMKEDLHQWLLDSYGVNNVTLTDMKLECPVDFYNHIIMPGNGSCENLSRNVARHLTDHYETDTIVTVLEDGENGASVHWEYEQ